MNREPPYFDWPLDRWKLLVILLLFILLLLGALFWPLDAQAATSAELIGHLPDILQLGDNFFAPESLAIPSLYAIVGSVVGS